MKVYIPQDIDPAGKNYLLERGYELKIGSNDSPEVMLRQIADCDALIVRVAKVSAALMDAAPLLKVIGRHGVGVDNIDLDAARARGIRVTNGPESNAVSVAEHTVALTLAAARRLPYLNEQVHTGNWNIRNAGLRLTDLQGKTAGLVGFGRIARLVAKKLALGFDMKILTYGSHHLENLPNYVSPAASLEDLFRRSDVISLHCPLKAETSGMITADLISCAKPGALFINTARAELVDETALFAALQSGQLAAAGLDVLDESGDVSANPLLTLPNVFCTPHCASHTKESFANMSLHAAMGVDEVLTGRPVTWPVV